MDFDAGRISRRVKPLLRRFLRQPWSPNTEIFQLAVGVTARGQYLVQMAPIHADVVDGSAEAEGGEVPASLAEKGGEPRLSISPAAIGKGRWWIAPRPIVWPSIGTL